MDIMMSMRDRHETDGEQIDKICNWTPRWRSSAVPVQLVMSRVGRVSDGTCTKRKMLTWDQQTAADGEGGTPRSCTVHATAHLHTRIRQRSSKRRRVLPKSFRCRRIRSGSRHVHLALACASRTGLSKTSPFDQMGRCSGQNGSTRRAN